MTDIFIYKGGAYKQALYGRRHAQDDGDYRAPLNCAEAQFVLHDPELPGRDYPGAYQSDFVMAKHIDRPKSEGGIADLAVGDYVYIHVIPNMSVLTSFAAVTDYAIDGFSADFEIVDACQVYDALRCGKTGVDVAPLIPAIAHDFSCGLGNAIKDAVTKAAFDCSNGEDADWTKYRNPNAVNLIAFDKPLAIRGAAYIRLKIKAVPDAWDNPCTSCKETCNLPRIQVGLTGAVHSLRLHELLPYCDCPEKICPGCESSCPEKGCV